MNAQFNLGLAFRDGIGVEQGDVQATKYFQMAANQGDAAAQHNLAHAFFHGLGVQQDSVRAVQLWQRAADQGIAEAQHALSNRLFHGDVGVPQNTELAYKFAKLAASQGADLARPLLVAIKAALAPRACAACSTVEPALRTYPKCERFVYYCNAACQHAHWKQHKLECKELADKAEAEKRGVFASMSQAR